MNAKYVLGIDLGTTNSVLAYTSLDEEQPTVALLPIPQLVDANTVELRTSLPSFLYSGGGSGVADGLDLPWAHQRQFAVGEFARRQSAMAPERTISAAKSWLCHGRVDRRAPILPWQAPAGIDKISPVVAAQRYLEHLIAAWEHAFPHAPVAEQQVVLTVPASFDAVARELTREAALAAGLPSQLVLLEEPQAAVYCWLASRGDGWRKTLKVNDRLLVCDVGGGTTDLTLIGVTEQSGELELRRLAVGNHLLVGGDNMDLALAHFVAGRFAEQGVKLDPWQSVALWHSCRTAKEVLLGENGPATHTISVLGRGSRLIGGTVSVEVEREAVTQLLADGFFPACQRTERPRRQRQSGFQEIGLPFEADTAITRHVAAFLADQAGVGQPDELPNYVLFNGGAFKASRLRQRLLETLDAWSSITEHDAQAVTSNSHNTSALTGAVAHTRSLDGVHDLDHAVARGAAYYGWSKQRGGIRIRGGTARSYYIGIETAGLAIPGAPRPMRALCVVPFGMEEGTQVDVPSPDIGLVHGEPATFRFFCSALRKQDQPGDFVDHWTETELVETSPLEATLPADDLVDEPFVPVRFQSHLTELGMFELWCVGTQTSGKWKLEFSLRDEDDVLQERVNQ